MSSSDQMGKHPWAVEILSEIFFPTPGGSSEALSVGDKKPLYSEIKMVHLGHLYASFHKYSTLFLPSDTLTPDFNKLLTKYLSHFTAVEGSYSDNYAYNFAGVEFIHASAIDLKVADLQSPKDVSQAYKQLIPSHPKINYTDQFPPICALQVTQLSDGHFIGCSVSHPLINYPPFRNFFNDFTEDCSQLMQGVKVLDFLRKPIPISKIELRLLNGDTKVTFNPDQPSLEKVLSFTHDQPLLEKVFRSTSGDPLLEEDFSFTPGDLKGVWSIPEEPLLEKVSSSTGESIQKLEVEARVPPPRWDRKMIWETFLKEAIKTGFNMIAKIILKKLMEW